MIRTKTRICYILWGVGLECRTVFIDRMLSLKATMPCFGGIRFDRRISVWENTKKLNNDIRSAAIVRRNNLTAAESQAFLSTVLILLGRFDSAWNRCHDRPNSLCILHIREVLYICKYVQKQNGTCALCKCPGGNAWAATRNISISVSFILNFIRQGCDGSV